MKAIPIKKKRTTPYDDGTMSYAAQAPASPTGATDSAGVVHAPSTLMYFNPDTVSRQGYREEGRKQYGVGSEYYKGLDDQGKRDFITRMGGRDPVAPSRMQQALGSRGGQSQRSPLSRIMGASTNQKIADAARARALDKAYQGAANRAYGLQGIKDEAILSQLGKAGPHREWREVFDNVSGKSLGYYQKDMKSGRGGALEQSWNDNQDAWQAGIGAVTGLISGGPAGMVVGGAAGYASGKQAKDQRKEQRRLERMQNKKNIKDNINPNRPRMLRDVARSRAAGAGSFNYTEQVEG